MKHLVKYASTLAMASVLGCGGGGGGGDGGPPPCDTACKDGVAIVGLRELIKTVYNFYLQMHAVGAQNVMMMPCPLAGKVTITGTATSNAAFGTTTVNLTYVLAGCAYSQVDTDPTQTLSLTFDGTVTEVGTLASQPSSTTSLVFKSPETDDAGVPIDGGAPLNITGTVYSPALDYDASGCALVLGQNGNDIAGTICGREAGALL